MTQKLSDRLQEGIQKIEDAAPPKKADAIVVFKESMTEMALSSLQHFLSTSDLASICEIIITIQLNANDKSFAVRISATPKQAVEQTRAGQIERDLQKLVEEMERKARQDMYPAPQPWNQPKVIPTQPINPWDKPWKDPTDPFDYGQVIWTANPWDKTMCKATVGYSNASS